MKEWISDNKREIIYLLVGLGIGILGTLLFYSGVVLKDGNLVLATANNKKYTSNQIYSRLKDSSGLSVILRLIDADLVKKELGTEYDEAALEDANTQAEQYLSMYTQQGVDEATFLNSYGFRDKNDFISYLADDYRMNIYFENYLKNQITNEEVQTYYDENAFEEKSIIVYSGSEEDLNKVKSELKKGTSSDKIKEKYSDIVVNPIEDFSFDLITAYTSTFVNTVKDTSKGKYSDVVTDNEMGYYIIQVIDTKEIPSFENTEDNIKSYLATDASSDQLTYYQAFIELRDKYKIKFKDSSLKNQYEEYKKQYLPTEE